MDGGCTSSSLDKLADALGLPLPTPEDGHTLFREVLRQLLVGLSFCHAKGIVHRDIKPENILVDPEARCLRFIDFGSGCDIGAWLNRKAGPLCALTRSVVSAARVCVGVGVALLQAPPMTERVQGYRGAGKGVRTILYCAPEEFVEAEHPYAFDVYSAAVTWLRLVVPGLRRSVSLALGRSGR